jgi:hypothetical protein
MLYLLTPYLALATLAMGDFSTRETDTQTMRKTTTAADFKYMAYLTKHLRKDLHDRLRVQGAISNRTVEDVLNQVLAAGLPIIENRTLRRRIELLRRGGVQVPKSKRFANI